MTADTHTHTHTHTHTEFINLNYNMARDDLFIPLNIFLRVSDPVGLWLYTSDIFCEGLAEALLPPLCPRTGGLKHILSCCTKAAGEGMLLVVSLRWWGQELMLSTQGSPAAHYSTQQGRQLCCVARAIAKPKNRWASCNHLGMVAVGWPRMAAHGLRLHCKDQYSKANGLAEM